MRGQNIKRLNRTGLSNTEQNSTVRQHNTIQNILVRTELDRLKLGRTMQNSTVLDKTVQNRIVLDQTYLAETVLDKKINKQQSTERSNT